MDPIKKTLNVQRTLILLTILFVFGQLTFLALGEFFSNLVNVTLLSMNTNFFLSTPVVYAFIQFLFSQFVIYSMYIFLLWYVITTIVENLRLGYINTVILTLGLWLNSVISLLTWNSLYVPHSIFTKLIRHDLFNDALTDANLRLILYATVVINLASLSFTIATLVADLCNKKHIFRHAIFLSLGGAVLAIAMIPFYLGHKTADVATVARPNIIIVSFDAVRPDFLSYFNPDAKTTPYFDAFLESSIVFPRAYASIARTMPVWAEILTAQYPNHNQVRENNTLLDLVKFNETLPKRLQDLGYTTVYATDDRRYNHTDERYGFDNVVGPAGTVPDFMLGTLNDLPLSNFIAPTLLGKLFFPFNYANHGADFIYNPNSFLSEINNVIRTTPADKPLFLAVHFNLSGRPFTWYNDNMPYSADGLSLYENSIAGDDKLLASFYLLLKKNQLLNHAIVVLISDHGFTHGLPGDRLIKEANYVGHPSQMKVKRFHYSDEEGEISGRKPDVLLDVSELGIDTSYGYGNDILSLKQNVALFAIHGYNVDLGQPHHVDGRTLLLDIAPTILDILNVEPMQKADGLSLKPYLKDPKLTVPARPIYLETAYANETMEEKNILLSKVLSQNLKFFYINPRTSTVALYPPLLKVLLESKQRAIIEGDWFLAYYPVSERYTFKKYDKDLVKKNNLIVITSKNKKGEKYNIAVEKHNLSPYFVLVNLKTGQWTTSLDTPLAENSPMNAMRDKLDQFFGDEMLNYSG